ncbi:MAG: alpha/beta hydrolase-fold protein, partial [Oscillospiraceae bacterium]
FVLPEVQRSFYTDMAYGLPYFTYITEELPQICERYFGLSREREKNFIFGLSMGGYGALKAALTKPEQYSICCAFSAVCDIREWIATHGKPYTNEYKAIWGMDFELLEQNDLYTIAKQAADYNIKPKIYIASGTGDFIHSMSVTFREYLYNLGYDFTYEQWEGGHEWCFWNEAIVHACEFAFG